MTPIGIRSQYLFHQIKTTIGRDPSEDERHLLRRWNLLNGQRRLSQMLITDGSGTDVFSLASFFSSKISVQSDSIEETIARSINDLVCAGYNPKLNCLHCRTPGPDVRGSKATVRRIRRAARNEVVNGAFIEIHDGTAPAMVAASGGGRVREESEERPSTGDAVILLRSPSGEYPFTSMLRELRDTGSCIATTRVEEGYSEVSAVNLTVRSGMGIHLNSGGRQVAEEHSFMAVIRHGAESRIRRLARKHDVAMNVAGRVSNDKNFKVQGADIALPISCFGDLGDEGARLSDIPTPPELKAERPSPVHRLKVPKRFHSDLLELLASGECAVAGRHVRTPSTGTVSMAASDQFVKFGPKRGAQAALASACRKIVTDGATPVTAAVAVHLPVRLTKGDQYRFREIAEGITVASSALQINVRSAKVWFSGNIDSPLLTVVVAGEPDPSVTKLTSGFKGDGDFILMLGSHRGELGCSAYARLKLGKSEGPVPMVDLAMERQMREIILIGNKIGLIKSAIHNSAGGLATTIAQALIHGGKGLGARIHMSSKIRDDELLFGETQGLTIISVAEESIIEIERLCMKSGVPCTAIGRVTDSGIFTFNDLLKVKVERLREVQKEGVRRFFG